MRGRVTLPAGTRWAVRMLALAVLLAAISGGSRAEARGAAVRAGDRPVVAGTLDVPLLAGDITMLAFRGPGYYISLWKLAACWLLMLAWVATCDWVSRDCFATRQNYVLWNSVVVFPFFAALLLVFSPFQIPFIVVYVILAATYLVPVLVYIYVRNESVEPYRRVLTPDHIRVLLTGKEPPAPHEKGVPVELASIAGRDERENSAALIRARQLPGFFHIKELIADLVKERAHAAMFDYGSESVAVRYEVDGIWHNNEPQERGQGDEMLEAVQVLAGMETEQKRPKGSKGRFAAQLQGSKFTCHVIRQVGQNGQRVMVRLDDGKQRFSSFEELGMRESTREKMRDIMGGDQGFVLFAARPADGLTTTIDVALEETDRLLRSFASVEDESRTERDMINVERVTYNSAAGETPLTVLPKLVRTYPDVIVVRNLDGETVKFLCEQVEAERLVVGSVRAASAAEAVLRVLALKVPPKVFAPALTAVVYCRLIRKLCPDCRVAYEPTADLLKKLRVPADRVTSFFREPTEEEVSRPCETCGGIGYYGRTAMFEVLVVDDKVREAMIRQPQLDVIKKAARSSGMRTVQEEGILLVAKGVTSLHELMRVLKH